MSFISLQNFAVTLLLFSMATPAVRAQELADSRTNASGLVVLGGSITEIVYALGKGGDIVGADLTSIYPPAAKKHAKLGYFRQISAEGVLSLNPKLVLASEDAGPPGALAQIRSAGVPVEVIPSTPSIEGAKEKIKAVAKAVGAMPEAARIIAGLEEKIETLTAKTSQIDAPKSVLFIYARGGGTLNVSGRSTAADAIIRLAGGKNAISSYEDYRPLTPEAVVAAAPDVILLLERGFESIGGEKGLLEVPGIALTPAGQNRAFLSIDDMLMLSFGPRLGDAALELYTLLYH
ncbi:MAG: hemin ABC transporter substrate-binding protein [Bacteroidota bacterium]